MELPKSQVEFYLDLCVQLVRCDPLRICSSKELNRDIETMKSRVATEGLSFLTKTLPQLGKSLDEALTTQTFSVPRAFKRAHGYSSIPAFMQAYFKVVLNESGLLREEFDVGALTHLRQVLFFAYKLEVPYSPDDVSRAIEKFVTIEEELELELPHAELSPVLDLASRIAEGILSDFDPKDILPRHGPGAVATGERMEEKWVFSRLYDRIHQFFPYYHYFVVGGGRELIDRLEWYKSLHRLETGAAKLVAVPKDSRGPRLISAEPLEFQWIQQGLGRKLAAFLENGRNALPQARINFSRQDINQTLALRSSTSGANATIDLSDASDRVSLALVREVLKGTPRILAALEASRTDATTLPSGKVLPLKKFAPMGSALCFPVEAFIFWVVIVAAIVRVKRVPLKVVAKSVYVYGDDIIVPTEWASLSIQYLELAGLRVNKSKSCSTGYFRESCGVDAFKGEVVTPLRLKKPWTNRPGDGTAFAAYVSLANRLQAKGYALASESLWKAITRCFGVIPHGTERSSFPCRIVREPSYAEARNLANHIRRRWNSRFQRCEFSVSYVRARKADSKLDGWSRLLRNQVFPSLREPSHVVMPRSTTIKRGWMPVT